MTAPDAPRKPLVLVAAVSANGVIGREGGLPWHIPEDLRHFKRSTVGHALIMGRRTWESLGGPLPRRQNIVVTRRRGFEAPGAEVAHSLEEAIALARQDDDAPRVGGGTRIYAEALPLATRLVLTEVHQEVEGDTFFPAFDRSEWVEVERDERDGYAFVTLERRG